VGRYDATKSVLAQSPDRVVRALPRAPEPPGDGALALSKLAWILDSSPDQACPLP